MPGRNPSLTNASQGHIRIHVVSHIRLSLFFGLYIVGPQQRGQVCSSFLTPRLFVPNCNWDRHSAVLLAVSRSTWPTLRASQVSKERMMLVIECGVTPEALFIRTLVDARRWSGSTTLLQIPELCGDIILGD